jgi:glycogen phosphorylase
VTLTTYPHLHPGSSDYDLLVEAALNLSCTRDHWTDDVWAKLDPDLWESTENPWLILQTVSLDKIREVLADADVQEKIKALAEKDDGPVDQTSWFPSAHGNSALKCISYFSMEYMLSETLPIYSGGLGNVAGDQLKAADDLGVPVVAVGLLYSQGYFRQELDADGNQMALYPTNNPGHLPITPLRRPDGQWLRLQIDLPGAKLWIRTWEAKVGRTTLYLLDTNDPANTGSHRCITGELYGGGPEMRLKQEMVLGIGGWRLLRELGIEPEVCHLNEGHAAFATLERAHSYMQDHKVNFAAAATVTRAGNLFTTHTAVEAGFDRFPSRLIEIYFKSYAEKNLNITMDTFLSLGRAGDQGSEEPFNMAFLAVHMSGAVNGVSELHGKVSRQIFHALFPKWPRQDVPIGHVTNGVHMPTWMSKKAAKLWTDKCGEDCWSQTPEECSDGIRTLSDTELWSLRTDARKQLIEATRRRYTHQVAESGASEAEVDAAMRIFDANALTLGFARRFATYKRPNLLLHDPERLARILTNREHPVQLILAGKAHPQDRPGQALIKQWSDYMRRNDIKGKVVFLSDYDMQLAQQLAPGIDLWLNTPRRPWEASGTSGMKVLANGGLNLSELDGWWVEAFNDRVGWALGDGNEHGDDPAWDAVEAEALYTLLEQQVIPEFYERDNSGVPVKWTNRIRASMAELAPPFSASRTVKEYTEKYYLQAANLYQARCQDNGRLGAEIQQWQQHITEYWSQARFGDVAVEERDNESVFTVHVYLGELSVDSVQVELYADAAEGHDVDKIIMSRDKQLPGSDGGYSYTISVPKDRPSADFTPRLIPVFSGALVPLELPKILWQR